MNAIFWIWVVVIVVLSLVNNWLVQLVYYLKTKEKHVGQRTLLQYYTGYLGDGLIAPVINVLVFYILYSLGFWPGWNLFILALVGAIVLDIVVHCLQGKLKLVNWSMTEPYCWNFAGKWHMISLPIQMTYLFVFTEALWLKTKDIFLNFGMTVAADTIFVLMALFVLLYLKDNKRV